MPFVHTPAGLKLRLVFTVVTSASNGLKLAISLFFYYLTPLVINNMLYREYYPTGALSNHVQCYFTCETDSTEIAEDKVFASGYVEIMFNLDPAGPQKILNGSLTTQPRAQLWGQTIRPFTFTSGGKHAMLGVRFYPHTAACFFDEPIDTFNDLVVDYADIAGPDACELCTKLMDPIPISDKITLAEGFLLNRLNRFGHKFPKLKLVNSIVSELNDDGFFKNINTVAARYGMSARYLQKIFLSYSGLSPGLFSKIVRFQKSLQLMVENEQPLTVVAYSCGYYDQSHFIKDFKSFTGSAPSQFCPESSTDFFVPLAG